ncbi:MAG: helix-turn-helix domain-containing protein [Ethanoligenens sp.]
METALHPVKMLTIKEAARLVPGLTRYRIRTMCISGELPCVRAGRKYLICEQVLLAYLLHPKQEPEQPVVNGIRRVDAQ